MEREAFSRRLRQALANIGDDGESPTRLAREFNRHYPGAPISLHAARKWLLGDAIPAQDKLRILAEWLNVKAEWLRYGEMAGAPTPVYTVTEPRSTIDFNLARDIAGLPLAQQEVVRALVQVLRAGKLG